MSPPGRWRTRSLAAWVVASVALAGCARAAPLEESGPPRLLVPSTVWRGAVSAEDYRARVAALTRAIEALRRETSSGWTGRQDDATGYLGELSGGRYGAESASVEAVEALLEAYGPDLFGIDPDDVRFGPPEETPSGEALRGEQHVAGVPVLDAGLVAATRPTGDRWTVTALRGRVFPGLGDTDTEPRISAGGAARVAEETSGGTAQGRPRLVIMSVSDRGALAWEVRVVGGSGSDLGVADYLVDAVEGLVLGVRPGAQDARALGEAAASPVTATGRAAVPEGTPVEVSGPGPIGDTLRGMGLRMEDGSVVLVDTTTPFFDPETGAGAVSTHRAAGLPERRLPGPLAGSDGPDVDDPDALAAHVYGRAVLDYYHEVHGRRSWDGQGGTLVSSTHFGPPRFCNAYFGEQMVYGGSCIIDGEPQAVTQADVDTVAHEVTHGVTQTTSNLLYSGQSGALNESFSDYFGNVIGNRLKGEDTVALFEDACHGFTGPTLFCTPNPDGSLSLRYMLNGATFAEYAYLLDPPRMVHFMIYMDHGGVHSNSAVWNHATWSIRTRLAQMDGLSGNDSPRAARFDAVMYAALTRHLTPTSGFLDARAAVEQAALEEGADAETLRVIRETFDAGLICQGCTDPPPTPAVPVATTSAAEASPAVSGDRVAWVELTRYGVFGLPTHAEAGGPPSRVPGEPLVLAVAFAGEALVAQEATDEVVRYDPATGSRQVLGQVPGDDIWIPVAGSEDGAAWVDLTAGTLSFVDPTGTVASAPLPPQVDRERFLVTKISGVTPVTLPVGSVGVGGGTVGVGTASGEVVVWTPGSGDPRVVATLPGRVLGIDVHGDRVLAVTEEDRGGRAVLVEASTGATTTLSSRALAFGAAVSGEYAVWTEVVGPLPGMIAEERLPDTNLALYSFATGRTYEVVDQRGMQGFPALSGRRLAWQDGVNGGDDIYTGVLPAGL